MKNQLNPKNGIFMFVYTQYSNSYAGQSLVVNEIFPPMADASDNDDSDVDDFNTFHIDRSDASRTPDEDATSDDDAPQQPPKAQLQFSFD